MKNVRKMIIACWFFAVMVLSVSFATPSNAAKTYTKNQIDSIITSKNKVIDGYNNKVTNINKKVEKLNKKIKKLNKKIKKLKKKKIDDEKKKTTKEKYKKKIKKYKKQIKKYKKQIKKYKKQIKGYNTKIKGVKKEVKDASVPLKTVVSSININLDGDDKLCVNEDYIVKYTVSNKSSLYPASIKWSSSNESVATISTYDGDMTLSIVGSGDAMINAVVSSSNLVTTMAIHVDVPNAYVEDILVGSRDATVKFGTGDYTDNYQIVFADDTLPYEEDLEWTCSDLNIATLTWTTDPEDNTKGTFTIHPLTVGDVRVSVVSDYSEGGTTIDIHVVE